MYESFFGLREAPFTLTPNTHFFLKSETHRQALETLLVALSNKEGFIKITGEVGTGKTLLCRKLLNALNDDVVTAYIPNPCCSAETLYCLVADELGASELDANGLGGHEQFDRRYKADNFGATEKQVLALRYINERLIEFAQQGKQVVLLIDEAQSMPVETIEALRLLTNLETESEKLLHIVLFGQPELDRMLAQENLRQLQQRISFQHRLQTLGRADIERYVSHRMLLAGYTGGRLFDVGAITLLCRGSKGVPRLVNVLCHKALMLAYGQGQKVVSRKHMHAAIKDTESAASPSRFRMPWHYAALIFLFNSLLVPLMPDIATATTVSTVDSTLSMLFVGVAA